ncbi:Collagen triple helix repeat (20 copies) [Streptomyces sp. ADI95-17]|nr:collagen-like protein [Streptomyces sp. ADI95-17]RPK74442.1 Collagen triple helix repeat (20 copies) [Streptomyces sp. ADI95-17]
MHRRPDVLVRQWRTFALAAVLLVLSGAVLLVWLRIGAADRRADDLAAEADRRGTAVSTLAGDVRVLRAQIAAKGETPAAPDPGRAVTDLPDRAQVPVPIPGPAGARGERGATGPAGKDAPTPTPVPGPAGPPGADGATVTGPPGPAGADGKDGADGSDGRDGADGQTCPAGYSLQPPPDDPDGLMCRRNAPSGPDSSPSPTVFGLPAERRRS